jgi:hypothetical protein
MVPDHPGEVELEKRDQDERDREKPYQTFELHTN